VTLRESRLTIMHPYYNDESRLKYLTGCWAEWSPQQQDAVDVVLVDDGSKTPIHEAMNFDLAPIKNITLYRITEDLKYNTPGALNLGFYRAPTDWVLTMDTDCVIMAENLDKLLNIEPNPAWMYQFERERITMDDRLRRIKRWQILGCALLVHKDLYTNVGGFDEDFTGERSGGYGHFDTDFTHKVGKLNRYIFRHDAPSHPIIHEYMEDIVGPNIQTKTNDTEGQRQTKIETNNRLRKDKYLGRVPRSREHLRFKWKKVYERRG